MSCCLSTVYPCFPTHFWSVDPDAKVPAWREQIQRIGDKDARWKHVRIKAHNEEGGTERSTERILDMVTGELYLKDPLCSVRFKCCLISTFSCLYGAAMMTTQFVKVVIDVAKLALDILRALCGLSCEKVFTAVEQHFKGDLGSDLFTFVASPLYWLGMELGALIGAFYSPYEGRKIVTHIEMSWHRTESYKKDARFTAYVENRSLALHEVVSSEACFLAFCFTVRGHMDDVTPDGKHKYTIESVEDIADCC